MRTSNPRGVTSRLVQLTTTHHTNNPTSTPFFKDVSSSTSSSPSAAALGSSSRSPRVQRVQQSASFHTNLRQQQQRQQFFPIITRRSSTINHPLLNFPYRGSNKQPTPTTATLAPSRSTTSPRMASTSVPRSPSPAAAASTSAAPGSSQPRGSANQVGAAAGNMHVLQKEVQQPRQPHQNQPSVSDGEIVEPSSTETEAAVGEADNKDPAAAAHTTTTSTIPALPAPGQGDVEGNESSRTLEVDGKAVALDHLGPMVVGRDGTVSRIANWGEMTEMERRNALRILCKRNQVRLAALRGEDSEGTGTSSS